MYVVRVGLCVGWSVDRGLDVARRKGATHTSMCQIVSCFYNPTAVACVMVVSQASIAKGVGCGV